MVPLIGGLGVVVENAAKWTWKCQALVQELASLAWGPEKESGYP